ncbi:MAG: hypothetical protein GXP56_03370 [Deltaproteobacteria bacterium]|nr:hypothetical protein [Deltaproteobacteria bacterium]
MPIFKPEFETLIQNQDKTIKKKIKLITTGHLEDKKFIKFARNLSNTMSCLVIESEKAEEKLPGFLLQENITYSVLPLEKELEPFLEALSQINGNHPVLSRDIRQTLNKIDVPVRLKLYIALSCPFCPDVVRTVIPLAIHCSNISLHIIDGSLFPGTARKDTVMSAPCLILDDDFRWTGSVTAKEIIKIIIDRNPSHLSAETLKTILEQGDAAWIAGNMIKEKTIFNNFIKLLTHETWSVRLGAMVVVEELAKADPELAAGLCPTLIKLFDEKDIPIQGDIFYALGETGNLETKEWIKKKLTALKHKDLIDAAEEALDALDCL